MQNFSELGLSAPILKSLEKLKITAPTPIQAQAIPAALKGQDVMATAQTGTGKTFAYLLPILEQIEKNAHGQAIILAPTRELAEQISKSITQVQKQNSLALIIGGASYYRQITALKRTPRFIVGTPGRILDLMQKEILNLEAIQYFVLDEMDRMLDMGFAEDLEKISKAMPAEKQTLMFSATLPPAIGRYALKYLKNPAQITIGSTTAAAIEIKQSIKKLSSGEKFTTLLEELDNRDGSVIIFVRTKISADNLADKLNNKGHTAEALHGDLNQRKRERVIRAYRSGKSRILVATDIAARGLDIPHIKHVVNYDLPQTPDDYIHRIGRTGRAGVEGHALSFVLPSEDGKWKAIARFLNGQRSDDGQRQSPQRRGYGHGGGRSQRGDRDRRPGRSDGKRGEWDRKPRAKDGERKPWDRKPKAKDGERPKWEDRKPRAKDGERPKWEDRKPRAKNGERPRWEERKPRVKDGERPRWEERKPRAKDGERPQWGERKPRAKDGERPQWDRKPKSSEGKRAEWERKPRSNDKFKDKPKTGKFAKFETKNVDSGARKPKPGKSFGSKKRKFDNPKLAKDKAE